MATSSTTSIVALPGTSYLIRFRVWGYGDTREFAVAGAWVSSGLGRYSAAAIARRREARRAIRTIRELLRSATTTEEDMLDAIAGLR